MSKKRDAIKSKQLILENAITLFAKNGYAKSSMEELASMCELNKAMVFYYYKNKKGLYEAVIVKILDEIYIKITNEIKTSSTSWEELESFIKTYAFFAVSHSYLPSLLLKELSSSAELPQTLFKNMKKLYSLFANIITKGIETKCFNDAVPMVLYFMIIGSINLMITTEHLRSEANENDKIDTCNKCDMEFICDYILQQVKKILKDTND